MDGLKNLFFFFLPRHEKCFWTKLSERGRVRVSAALVVQVAARGSPPQLCQRCGFHPCVGKIPLEGKWQLIPAFLPGEFHGQKSLAGYSPLGPRESDMTEQTNTPPGELG